MQVQVKKKIQHFKGRCFNFQYTTANYGLNAKPIPTTTFLTTLDQSPSRSLTTQSRQWT
jgi:hypothetical protein